MNEKTLNTTEEEFEIGRFGMAWWQFMTENYPDDAAELTTERRDELALDVEREALELRELLRRQYAKANPRPQTFTEIVKWENTCGFIVEREIMEQVVLQFRA